MAIGAISLFGVLGASCNAAGWVEDKIDQLMCKHEITEVIAAVDATCLEDGYSEYEVCIDCGYEVVARKVEKARGHQTVIVKGKPATCTGMGLSDGAICEVCGEIVVKQENTRALGHNKVEVDAVAPTCTKTGLTAGVVCDNEGCGQVFVAQQVVDMTAHVYYKDECRTCGAVDVEAIKATDTSAMREVEVEVGDSIGGGFYRLYNTDVDTYTGMIVLENNDHVGFGLYFDGLGAASVNISAAADYVELAAPADSKIVTIDSGKTYEDDGETLALQWIDIYIPANVNEIWNDVDLTLNIIVNNNNTNKLVAYVSMTNIYAPLSHVPGCLFKLVP